MACEHFWNYVHAVYSGPKGGTCARRWCYKCNVEQVGRVGGWREPKPREFSETARRASKEA